MRRWRRMRRHAIRCFGVGAASLVVLATAPGTGQALSPAAATVLSSTSSASGGVTLNGEGASDPAAELKSWQNDLYGSDGTVNLNYIASGGYKARQDLLSGTIDYAISGVPFTPAELATLPKGQSFVDAPVMASALGALVTPPYNPSSPTTRGFGLLTSDANGNPVSYQPYTGPIKVPMDDLAAMIFNYSNPSKVPSDAGLELNEWDNPQIVKAFGLKTQVSNGSNDEIDFTPSGSNVQPVPTLRSDPSETDYYSELLAEQAAPEVWQGLQANNRSSYTVADALPPTLTSVHTRQGLDTQLAQLGVPDVSGNIPLPVDPGAGGEGLLVPTQPSGLSLFKAKQAPQTQAAWLSVQDANGDWTTPSPTSIDAAVDAGGDNSFYGLSHPTPGAYPLTYIDHLYAPAKGLSADNTEAIATVIRYLATDGQSYMAANNDGSLSTGLVAQALAAANQLVVSNCTGASAKLVVSTDPGRFAPSTPGMKALGSMLHCEPVSSASSATGSGPGGSGGVSPSFSGSGAGLVPTTSADAGSSAANAGVGPGSTAASGTAAGHSPSGGAAARKPGPKPAAVSIGSALPISLPFSTGKDFDRFTALLVGAGLFFLGRRVVTWLIRVGRA